MGASPQTVVTSLKKGEERAGGFKGDHTGGGDLQNISGKPAAARKVDDLGSSHQQGHYMG